MKPPSHGLGAMAILLYAFLYAPIVVVVVWSFNGARRGVAWEGFSTRWYAALLENPTAWAAARNTLVLAVASTAISTVLGTMLGYGLHRHHFRGQRWCVRLLHLPVFIPDVVLAVALLLFYALVRAHVGFFELGLTTMIVGHVTFQIPFVALVVRARLEGLDRTIEEAAHDLGANAWQTFWHVTLPCLSPGVLAGAMLAFTLSLDDFAVSFFTSGQGTMTLPILIYASVKRGVTPDINALSTLIIVASIVATASFTLLQRKRGR